MVRLVILTAGLMTVAQVSLGQPAPSKVTAQASPSTSTPSNGKPRMFLEGAVLRSYDNVVVSDTKETSGLGARVGIGGRRFSAAVEWDTGREMGRVDDPTTPEAFFFTPGQGYMSLRRMVGHSTTFSVLVGVHTPAWKRVAFGLLGGPTFVASYGSQSGNLADRVGTGEYAVRGAWERSIAKHAVTPTIDLELPILITDHLFVVAELRGHIVQFPTRSVGRRGIAIRWRF